ncbi:diguanylate cyclase (GGDEF)-like protein/PAS domain S-box-containing protein [Sporosarcina luteola]|nr:diguanylate cyclase (GGDEF)-like protein/PAS domain S-box-containing protein [Sporosarcina luteola]
MIIEELKKHPSIYLLVNQKFCISMADRDGILLHVNENFCALTQYEASELIGKDFGFLNPDYNKDMFFAEMKEAFLNNQYWHRKIRSKAKDGSSFWVEAIISPIYNEQGEFDGFISVDTDVTASEITSNQYIDTMENLRNIENALDHSSVVAITDPQGVITYVNEKFCELSKYSAAELIGKTHRVVNSGFHPKSFFREMWETIGSGRVWQGDVQNRAKDGSLYWVATTIVPFLNKEGKPIQYVAIRHDITARKEAEKSLEIALRHDFRQTVKNLQNAIFKYKTDETGSIKFTLIEGKIAEKLGITVASLNTEKLNEEYQEEELNWLAPLFHQALAGETVQFELPYSSMTFLVYLSPIFREGQVEEVVGTAIDITERIEAEKVIEHMAYYDYLTGLPNRRLLQEKVTEWIQHREEQDDAFALLFMDLDRFKTVNDTMGHHVGDELLKAVGERLVLSVQEDDFVARLSGDEFVVLVRSKERSDVQAVADRIVEDLSYPYHLGQHEVFVAPSIGINFYPEDATDYNTLMRNADSAMYLAKESGRGTYQFFTKQLHDELVEQTMVEMELRQALQRNQLSLVYQPQFDLKTGQMKGMEALLRWHHPIRGFISPAYLIPIAEDTGLILPIGQWVLKTACQDAKEWQRQGLPLMRISVNVSIRQFRQPSFVSDVKAILEETGLEPQYLNLEITESIMSDVHQCRLILQELRDLGVNASIDDFGTGYSSLIYLSKFPLTHLKIDQAFISELDENNTMIVKAIIDLARNLNLKVVAEGVETEDQAHFLNQLHCDEVQGYLYAKPLSKTEFTLLLEEQKNLT